MENEQDSEWNDLLRSYKVADADDALLERIVAAAAESKVIPFKRPAYRTYLLNGSIAAALAVLGFFSGYASLPGTQEASAAAPASLLDHVILGPKTYSEISL